MISALIMAFSTYTKIPMPMLGDEEAGRGVKNMLCAFPITGLVIGLMQAAVLYILAKGDVNATFAAAILTVCPVFLNGGIHLDGFMDVSDAVSSWADREKKIQILKDPHIGSFAVIHALIYFLLYFGACSSIYEKASLYFDWKLMLVIVMIYPYERALSGLTAFVFRKMKRDGMLVSSAGTEVVKAVDRRSLVLIAQIIVYGAALGISGFTGVMVIIMLAFVTLYYKYFTYSVFGGVSGDTAGWFLQICELFAIMLVALT